MASSKAVPLWGIFSAFTLLLSQLPSVQFLWLSISHGLSDIPQLTPHPHSSPSHILTPHPYSLYLHITLTCHPSHHPSPSHFTHHPHSSPLNLTHHPSHHHPSLCTLHTSSSLLTPNPHSSYCTPHSSLYPLHTSPSLLTPPMQLCSPGASQADW